MGKAAKSGEKKVGHTGAAVAVSVAWIDGAPFLLVPGRSGQPGRKQSLAGYEPALWGSIIGHALATLARPEPASEPPRTFQRTKASDVAPTKAAIVRGPAPKGRPITPEALASILSSSDLSRLLLDALP